MKKWDGKDPNSYNRYPDQWTMGELMIDDSGTVYYTDGNGKICIWCPAIDLGRHLHHLNQIAARDNRTYTKKVATSQTNG